MGLAASQARLLSLTSRQHTIEANAQRLLSDKMRLSNNSDAAYQQYMNSLEETALKTRQTNDVGETFWIDGSINNLMRYNAADDTSGSVFFVQDLETSKLYLPQEILNKYDNYTAATIPAGHEYTNAMQFATMFGIKYKKIDRNEDILIQYNKAIANGWDKALTDEQYTEYTTETSKDASIQNNAKNLLGMIPGLTNNTYKSTKSQGALLVNYETFALELVNNPYIKDTYPQKNIDLILKSLDIIKSVDPQIPKAKVDNGKSIDEYDGPELPRGLVIGHFDAQYQYETKKLYVTKTGETDPYINYTDGTSTFNDNDKFELMLNGGAIKWEGTEKIEYKLPYIKEPLKKENEITDRPAVDIYDSEALDLLAQNGATNMGSALTTILNQMASTTPHGENLLKSWGKTFEDVVNYRKFQGIKSDYDIYQPDYEYVPTNKPDATYYENLFKSIEAAGGGIGVTEEQAKNTTWVENMIKNAKVILTTWDNNEGTLSRTSPALHVDVKEVTDDRKLAQAESDYEAEMALINEKDTKIDNILNKLETERTSIKTEIDGIEKVMKDNVSVNFKVFS